MREYLFREVSGVMRESISAAGKVLRRRRWPRLWITLWSVMIALVFAGSLLPGDRLPAASIFGLDKLYHLLGYAVLAAYAVLLFAPLRIQFLAMIALVALGIGIEIAQELVTASRRADLADIAANTFGVLLGWSIQCTRLRYTLGWIEVACVRITARVGS